jgi:UDP-N-acetylmuramate: L-alanyl-gamma-D-glutamyl-meso-diaminopimelate ligase
MHIHILGICGTFMSGIAVLAKQLGYEVSGSDSEVYPPMSTQLTEQGIALIEGYAADSIPKNTDCVVVGNVVKRGNPAMEAILNLNLKYQSGPEWLYENVLCKRKVLAVAGTHGKTTTSSLLAHILNYAGLNPGFLIGGIPENFAVSARLGANPFFVIEADEYDTAFFDKRSKFIHYHPEVLVLNNLEYDHADIFADLAAIQQQFHYLIRTVPGRGKIIYFKPDAALQTVLAQGVWTPLISFGPDADWQACLETPEGAGDTFHVYASNQDCGKVQWQLVGQHNVHNALAAIAAAAQVGVVAETSIAALASFKNVKRRLEIKGSPKDIVIYDDFAHHPTAIATTLAGLRAKIGSAARMIAVLEFGSYTMRQGVHKDALAKALTCADMVVCKETETEWGLSSVIKALPQTSGIYPDVEAIVANLAPQLRAGDHVIIMSNKGFDGIHHKLINAINAG